MTDIVTKLRDAAQLIGQVADALDKPTEKPVTFVEVRTILAEKAGKGFADKR